MPLPPPSDFKSSPADSLHARLAALRLHHEEAAAAKATLQAEAEAAGRSSPLPPPSPPLAERALYNSSPPPYTEHVPADGPALSKLDSTKDDLHERFARLFGPSSLGELGAREPELDPVRILAMEESDDELGDLDDSHWERIEQEQKGGVEGVQEEDSVRDMLKLLSGGEDVDWLLVQGRGAELGREEEEEEVREVLREAGRVLPKEPEDIEGREGSDSEEEEKSEEKQVKEILAMEFDRLKLEAERERLKRPRLDPTTNPYDDDDSDGDLPIPPSPPKRTTSPLPRLTKDLVLPPSPPLGHTFPTAPSNASNNVSSSKLMQNAFSPPSAKDEEETWCTICLADAEYMCDGCDELFCEGCLWESHQGPDAGFEERRHRWGRIVKKGKKEEEEKKQAVGVGS